MNDYLIPELPPLTAARRIEDYVIENPGCTTRTIAADLGIPEPTASMTLSRLRNKGAVRPTPDREARRTCWEAGVEEDHGEHKNCRTESRRRVVRSWPQADIAPQTWFASLS